MKTNRMKYPLVSLFLFMAISLCCYRPGLSQITQVAFMKVKGSNDDYIKLEQEWRKMHQKHLEEGKIYAWYLIQRHFGGTSAEYDYVTVTVFPNMGAVQMNYTEEDFVDLDMEIVNKTTDLRDLIRTELFDTPIVLEVTHLPKYLNMAFMKVEQGKDNEYLTVEDEIWKPAHAEMKKSGVLQTWSVYRQLYPAGYGGEYNYVTVNGYADRKKIAFGPPEGWEEFMAKIHPEADIVELANRTLNSRKLIRNELWEIIDFVAPQ